MRRVGHLFEQIAAFEPLRRAARRAARGKPLSRQAAAFLLDLEPEVFQLERELLSGDYRPRGYRTFSVRDPKPRTISAAPFRDRVVHHALCAALEPVFERYAIDDSYACRKGKGQAAALDRAQAFSRRFPWFLKLDVLHFFERIDHDVLRRQLGRLIKDRRALDLCDRFLEVGAPGSRPGTGLPIGNLTSQHFANLYLGPLDHVIKERLRVPGYLRYMDDLLLFGPDRDAMRTWRDDVSAALAALDLELREDATRLGPVHAGVPFLGLRIWPRLRRLDGARARRFRRKTRLLERGPLDEADRAAAAQSRVAWAALADTTRFRRSFFEGGYEATGKG